MNDNIGILIANLLILALGFAVLAVAHAANHLTRDYLDELKKLMEQRRDGK